MTLEEACNLLIQAGIDEDDMDAGDVTTHCGETGVEWVFTLLNENETFVSITNSGFKGDSDKIIDQVRNSTEGFTLVLAGAKAYLEHHILLNLVLDRFPKGLA